MSILAQRADLSRADLIVERARTVEWVRRRVLDFDPGCAAHLARLLMLASSSERARQVLLAASTFAWLDTMVTLVDRRAPALLPDGQLAAQCAAVINLTAGLDGAVDELRVRCDEHAMAEIPALGLVLSAPRTHAGRTIAVSLAALPAGFTLAPTPEASDAPETTVAEPPVVAMSDPWAAVDVSDIVARWVRAGGCRSSIAPAPTKSAAEGLAKILTPLGIPTMVALNEFGADHIRQDATFDHLSLLSVRQPAAFEEVEAAVRASTGPFARLLSAHCAYIGARYAESASIYAELLVTEPTNSDLWRDVCWSLRHDGREPVTRSWVFHPGEVARTAAAVGFTALDPRPHPLSVHTPGSRLWHTAGRDVAPLMLVLDFMDWIADDLG
ncbi:hypothetical protein [Nocardia salmonicida]|uniref:hypothetical protein n=1 Tax=Nocardia salmonicida TaxID=53431 RepID=UPI003CFA2ED8